MFIVNVIKPRPDFRVFMDLLFDAGRNVDTDGDSYDVWSREWTELYIQDRESDLSALNIYAPHDHPTGFEVTCEDLQTETLAALYLFLYCGSALQSNGVALSEEAIETIKLKFQTELDRANKSIWHRSSADTPYPNLA